jgi:uncharacterized protein (DUF302 family)
VHRLIVSGDLGPGRAARSDPLGYGRVVSAYECLAIDAAPASVVAALREVLRSSGMTEYVVVDHGRDMAAAGIPGIVAWTLVFGNPAAGSKLLARDLLAAVDIPLRLAVVRGEAGGSEIVLRDMRSLLGDDLSELAAAFTSGLRAIAEQARTRAEAGLHPA